MDRLRGRDPLGHGHRGLGFHRLVLSSYSSQIQVGPGPRVHIGAGCPNMG
jgi:hypothetical protein